VHLGEPLPSAAVIGREGANGQLHCGSLVVSGRQRRNENRQLPNIPPPSTGAPPSPSWLPCKAENGPRMQVLPGEWEAEEEGV